MKKVDLRFCGDFGFINLYDVELLKVGNKIHISKNGILLSIVDKISLIWTVRNTDDGVYQYLVKSCYMDIL